MPTKGLDERAVYTVALEKQIKMKAYNLETLSLAKLAMAHNKYFRTLLTTRLATARFVQVSW